MEKRTAHGSDRECGYSSPATRSTRDPIKIDSVRSRKFITMNEYAVAIKPKALTMEEAALHPSGGLDRVSVDRTSEPEEGTKSPNPRGLRRSRNICNPVGEAPGSGRRYDDEHGESRLGQSPRCRYRHRLPQGRFRNHPSPAHRIPISRKTWDRPGS